MRRPIDILSAGELLVDFITAEFVQTLDEATLFKRIPGGSPANLAMNMARLGNNTMLAASVGSDDMGDVLRNYVGKLGVDTTYVAQVEEPTTLILVTRSAAVSNFQPYRGADAMLSIRQFPYQRFEEIGIFHTTCFALSKQPAQHVLLEAAEKAKRAGCQLSIDANYAEKIWPDRREAQRLVAEFCRLRTLIKVSDVDWSRLYEDESPAPDAVIDHFLKMGATEICFTLGDKGCWVGNADERHFLPARPVEVKDTTGAGDAFWSGYLTARLDEKNLLDCAIAGRRMAELKLSHFGPLPEKVDRASIYVDLNSTVA
ncbi:MAG: PfkB family carbohydrate kinase [Bacteroidetes bacterium]|nr:PfkB family carbohydrate kinase [Bacteroidota bacterium]